MTNALKSPEMARTFTITTDAPLLMERKAGGHSRRGRAKPVPVGTTEFTTRSKFGQVLKLAEGATRANVTISVPHKSKRGLVVECWCDGQSLSFGEVLREASPESGGAGMARSFELSDRQKLTLVAGAA